MKQGKQEKGNNNSPYDILSILRARQLAGIPVEIPPELIEQAKQYSGSKAAKLWEEIESMGIEVREMHYEGKHHGDDIYGYKICTPIGSYIGSASKDAIIELAEQDIEAAASAACPACDRKINYEDRDGSGNMVCPCGSIMGSIPTNFAEFAVELIMREYGLEGVYTTLFCWDGLYHHDSVTEYDWLLTKNMQLKNLPDVAVTIAKPSISSHTCTKCMPVFGSWEETEDINNLYDKFINGLEKAIDLFRIPSCSHCRYCIEVKDYAYNGISSHFCVHPVEKNNFIEKIGIELSFEREHLRGYQENNEGIIKNAFMDILLSEMRTVENQTREFEGKIASPFDNFYGPVCQEFDLDTEHCDLEKNGGPYSIVGEVSVVFGIPNIEAIEQEIIEKEKNAKLESIIQKAQLLIQSDSYAEKLFKTKIEMGNLESVQGRSLAQYLASKFTVEELQIVKDTHRLPIITSHKAYDKIIQKSIDLKKK